MYSIYYSLYSDTGSQLTTLDGDIITCYNVRYLDMFYIFLRNVVEFSAQNLIPKGTLIGYHV